SGEIVSCKLAAKLTIVSQTSKKLKEKGEKENEKQKMDGDSWSVTGIYNGIDRMSIRSRRTTNR
ncbi:hypothetical protein, partial [Acetobacterium bakii]|uniref:hypothetical protein n=1 Tax=Acetobacterium bakii TaxID=52689 RepID=UPI001FA80728